MCVCVTHDSLCQMVLQLAAMPRLNPFLAHSICYAWPTRRARSVELTQFIYALYPLGNLLEIVFIVAGRLISVQRTCGLPERALSLYKEDESTGLIASPRLSRS